MTILSKVISKVKTLIEYAKFGTQMSEMYRGNLTELYVPKSMPEFDGRKWFNGGITTLTGRVKKLTPTFACTGGHNTVLEYVNLPECVSTNGGSHFSNAKALKVCKLPALTSLPSYFWDACTALKYIEVGALESMDTSALRGCTAVEEFKIGEGTNCNMAIYQSKNLTQECLHSIIDAFADHSNTTALILHIHEECAKRITDEYKQKAADKNINIVEVKG
jgi:nitrogen regulatory protein PII-like uncharacterized protein